jgi:hypothetical protein
VAVLAAAAALVLATVAAAQTSAPTSTASTTSTATTTPTTASTTSRGSATSTSSAASARSTVATAAIAQVTQLRKEITGGTLLSHHDIRPVCAQCESVVVTAANGSSEPLSTAVSGGYGPADLASAYKITGTSSSTATIAIIDAGVDGNLVSDLATYRTTYGLPACTTASGCLTLENYTGGAQPAPQTSGDGAEAEEEIAVETALDVDMASAACPSCHILEISVPWQDGVTDADSSANDFSEAVSTAALAGAKAISISYGYTPSANTTSGIDLLDFVHPGVAIEASTGDSGFNGGTHTSWPSDLPYVIGVGGTQLAKNGDSWSETAWGVASGKGSAGSGCETFFPAANGQPAAVTKDCDNHLATASVSADASPATPLAVYDTYTPYTKQARAWLLVGGTSASSPYIAGLFARAGVPFYLLGPNTLYAAASSNFRDVTSGNNELQNSCVKYAGVSEAVCNAGTGWDGPTGLGTPQGLGAF